MGIYGIKGYMKLYLKVEIKVNLLINSKLQLLNSNIKKLVVVEKIIFHNKSTLILFKDLNDINKIKNYLNCKVYSCLKPLNVTNTTETLLNFICLFKNKYFGVVIDQQICRNYINIKIQTKNKTIWLPLINDFAEDVDKINKKIFLKRVN